VGVDEHLRVSGHDRVFAIGDISDADLNMAGTAGAQAEAVVATIAALITGTGEAIAYQPLPAIIAVPIGPEGGAGQLPGIDGIAGPEVIADVKGRALLIDNYAEMFDAPTR
jgi:NADH dehydrogenase FAD-containing subunit